MGKPIYVVQFTDAPATTVSVWEAESAHLDQQEAGETMEDLFEDDDSGSIEYRVVECTNYDMKVTMSVRPTK